MPLVDLGETPEARQEIQFRMRDGERRVLVRVSKDLLADAEARSGQTGFEAHRGAFAALATKKYAKGDREPDGSVVLAGRDI